MILSSINECGCPAIYLGHLSFLSTMLHRFQYIILVLLVNYSFIFHSFDAIVNGFLKRFPTGMFKCPQRQLIFVYWFCILLNLFTSSNCFCGSIRIFHIKDHATCKHRIFTSCFQSGCHLFFSPNCRYNSQHNVEEKWQEQTCLSWLWFPKGTSSVFLHEVWCWLRVC